MVLLKTLLIIYQKNDKQNSNKSVRSFYKIGIHKNFANLQKNTCAGVWPATLSNKRLQHRCFPINFVKPLIIPL